MEFLFSYMQKPMNAIKWIQLAVGWALNNAITPEYVGPACTEQTCRITCIVRIMIIMIKTCALIAWSSNFGARGRLTERQPATRLDTISCSQLNIYSSLVFFCCLPARSVPKYVDNVASRSITAVTTGRECNTSKYGFVAAISWNRNWNDHHKEWTVSRFFSSNFPYYLFTVDR